MPAPIMQSPPERVKMRMDLWDLKTRDICLARRA